MRVRRHAGLWAFLTLLATLGASVALSPFPAALEPARAQAPAPLQPSRTAGVLGGHVIAAANGNPIGRARVVVRSPALANARVVLTDASGRYTLPGLAPGRYTVTVSKTGYMTASLSTSPDELELRIELDPSQPRESVEVAPPEGAAITGRVLDEDRTPLAGARVEARRLVVTDGEPTVALVTTTTSDDRGHYRLGGLPAGSYFVAAADPAFDEVGDATGPLQYAPTYYPGVIYPGDAMRVSVEADQERVGIDVTLNLLRPIVVSGVIRASDDRPLIDGVVAMSPQSGRRYLPSPIRGATLKPDGTFIFASVPPGRYTIFARGETSRDDRDLFARFELTVAGEDIANIRMDLTPGAIVEGRIDFESPSGRRPPDLARLRVRAPMPSGQAFGNAISRRPAADGRFTFSGVLPGLHLFRVDGAPEVWVLKAVYLRGRAITETPLDLESGQRVQNLQVVLTDVTATLTGRVLDESGQARANYAVVVFPLNPRLWRPHSRRARVATSDPTGHYRVLGLPPGEYLVAVVREAAAVVLDDPSLLERLAATAVRVRLEEGETTERNLRVTASGPQIASASARRRPGERGSGVAP